MRASPFVFVVGGRARETDEPLEEWEGFEEARVLRVNVETGEAECVIRHVTPRDRCADHYPSILFKSGTRQGHTLFVCTQTEVLEYDLRSFELQREISLPFFNDLHHVRPLPNGNLAVVVTGLDLVVEITREGDVVREWAVLDEAPFARFDRTIDYRKVPTTKPHLSHPNYAFLAADSLWATRFHQRDAIRLDDPEDRFLLGDEPPHDGHVLGDSVYFTTVRGKLVVLDIETRGSSRHQIFSIGEMAKGMHSLGWCRGLLLQEEGERAILGFTRLRKTKIRRNAEWLRAALRRGIPLHWPDFSLVRSGTMIVVADLGARRIRGHVDLEPHGLNAIFSIHAVPEA